MSGMFFETQCSLLFGNLGYSSLAFDDFKGHNEGQ